MYTELVRHQPELFAIHLNTSGLNWLGLLKIYYPIQHIILSALTAKIAQSQRPKYILPSVDIKSLPYLSIFTIFKNTRGEEYEHQLRLESSFRFAGLSESDKLPVIRSVSSYLNHSTCTPIGIHSKQTGCTHFFKCKME